jgi:hypothetical protein
MSLHALAGHMASKGRGSDSMLVHMTPEEVQSLQVLALKGGGTLTINPDTGLPEANFLKKMLPMIAGAALNFFLPGVGTAVGGMFGLGAAAGTGIAVGGLSALATGSLSRGLMAGLGAYGGASLAGGLESLGATAVAPEAMAAANASADPIMSLTAAKDAATAAGIAPAAGAEAAKQGLSMVADNPGSFMTAMGGPAKALGAAYAAATPVLAGEMVPTTTKLPETSSNAYIRQKRFDPYTQTYTDMTPIKASEWGGRSFSDAYKQPGMANGGIVALAAGGRPDLKEFMDTAKVDFQTASDLIYGVVGSNQDTRNWGAIMAASDPVAAARQATANMYGGVAINPIDEPGSKYRATSGSNINLTSGLDQGLGGRALNFGAGLTPGNDYIFGPSTQAENVQTPVSTGGGGGGGGGNTVFTGGNTTLTTTPVDRVTTPTDITTASSNVLPAAVSGSSGAGQIGGGAVVNPNGTITTSPRIPGIPVGGFTGIENLRNVYTDGGGSLGYQPFVPKTVEEFQAKFGNTGGSEQAYDYLAGKGASALIPATATGELMRPYGEAVLKLPAATNNSNRSKIFDPVTRTYKNNPNYIPVTFDAKTGANVAGLSANQLEALKVSDSAALQTQVDSGAMTYDQIAAALGISLAEAERRFPKKKVEVVTPPVEEVMQAANGGVMRMALGGLGALAGGGSASQYNLGGYSDGGRLLRGPGDGVSDSIPATIGNRQPARLADGEFVVPARIVSELGNGSTEAGARKLYAMMDRVQKARGKTTGKNRVAANTRSDKYLPA